MWLLFLALLVAPIASAAVGTLVVASPDPTWLRGSVTVHLPEATVRIDHPRASGAALVDIESGTVRIWTWRTTSVQGTTLFLEPPSDSAAYEDFRVRDTTLRIELSDELWQMTANTSDGGEVVVSGQTDVKGFPVLLGNPVRGVVSPLPYWPLTVPEYVPWDWDAGWHFVGSGTDDGRPGFPEWPSPLVNVSGPTFLDDRGGNLSFTDADGKQRAFRLGNWTEAGAPGVSGPVGAQPQTNQRMVFRGVVRSATLAPGGFWGVAAPRVLWDVDGAARWERATGEATVDGKARPFVAATVLAEGRFELDPSLAAAVPTELKPARYAGEGDFARLVVEGDPLVSLRPLLTVAEEASLASIVLLAILSFTKTCQSVLFRAAGAFYTRISSSNVLLNPTRARIYETVVAQPGIHKRALQRVVSVAWGPMEYHLRRLEKEGLVGTLTIGKYQHLHASPQSVEQHLLVAHPIARAVLDQLPGDGRAVLVEDVRRSVGASRQTVDYHLRSLARRGLVRVDVESQRRIARRTEPPPVARG